MPHPLALESLEDISCANILGKYRKSISGLPLSTESCSIPSMQGTIQPGPSR